ncbi:MAG TPA: DMT family transporter [Myxococcales bacterium]|nr:DMT family transporter [Myxococcales bacterium]
MPGTTTRLRGAAFGLAAAALFGASAPAAKVLLGGMGPLALAGLLYAGAALALTGVRLARRGPGREARLSRSDAPLLAVVAVAGGVLGPVLMLVGLQRLPAMTASLLLNLEAPLTMLLAVSAFREHLSRRELLGAALVIGGGAALGAQPGALAGSWPGVAAIFAACLCWGLDNNLTQRLSGKDPVAVVQWKAGFAGACALGLAAALGERVPAAGQVGAALVLGSLSYGASIVLDAHALRLLGAAREAAFFATAPFVGAAISVAALGERPSLPDAAGALAMVAGVAVLVRARHGHAHTHEAMEHDHLHVHDEHHRHAHDGEVAEPHAHPHAHAQLTHDHPHVSDAHHRHRH